MFTKPLLIVALLGAASLGLGACTSTGIYVGESNDGMRDVWVHNNPDEKGPLTQSQYLEVAHHAGACLKDYRQQVPGPLAAMANSAVVGAGVGALEGFTSGNIVKSFVHGVAKTYLPEVTAVDAAIGGIGSANQALVVHSQGTAVAIADCTNGDLSDPVTRSKLGGPGTHVYMAPVTTRNASDHVPSWVTADQHQ